MDAAEIMARGMLGNDRFDALPVQATYRERKTSTGEWCDQGEVLADMTAALQALTPAGLCIAPVESDVAGKLLTMFDAIKAAVTAERRRCAKIANDKADELYAAAGESREGSALQAQYAHRGYLARSIATAISIGEGE